MQPSPARGPGRTSLGWRDPLFLASRPSGERVRRFVAMLLMLQRLSYLLPACASLFADEVLFSDRCRNAVLLALALAWNVTLFQWVARRGWFTPLAVVIDALATCVFMVGVTGVCLPESGTCESNWSSHALLATGALIGAVSERAIQFAALLPAIVVYAIAHADDLGLHTPFVLELAVRVNSYVWFAVIVFFIRRYLAAQAMRLDGLTEQRLTAEAERVAEQARLAHYRQLHDTVLATLTAIARGGLDHRTEEVRRRCAADAAYVRALIRQDAAGPATGLGNGLARAVARAAGLGLCVRFADEALPEDLPAGVAAAMTEAAEEALNNVARHSGERDAWLTAIAVDGVVTVRVVDRGSGFDPGRVELGYGLRSSVIDRMREVGGRAEIITAAGEGVCVELRWPDRPP
ncbi:sensor histidine kinase [Nonomuraea sediminis]|uniref:sensor histidine kinase n=1 Tax=Nonomuraea sediminis TaxID=2835864 RepID=UPI00202ABF1C|nr:ATP-binding protein [Nonomuraea sediminis]